MGKCLYYSGEKSDLFVETFLIFENTEFFLKYFAEIYEKEIRENASTKYPKFHTTKGGIMLQAIQDGDTTYKSRPLTLASVVCSGNGCIL